MGATIETINSDKNFANLMKQLDVVVPTSVRGKATAGKIPGYVWHHSVEKGVMQLVPQAQHTTGSTFWKVLHPTGKGGMSLWGGGYK